MTDAYRKPPMMVIRDLIEILEKLEGTDAAVGIVTVRPVAGKQPKVGVAFVCADEHARALRYGADLLGERVDEETKAPQIVVNLKPRSIQ